MDNNYYPSVIKTDDDYSPLKIFEVSLADIYCNCITIKLYKILEVSVIGFSVKGRNENSNQKLNP